MYKTTSVSTIAGLGLLAFATAVRSDPIVVQSVEVQVAYNVNRDAEPLSAVMLWYTQNGGETWTEFGPDPDRRSPIAFRAPGNGEYGLFFVLENETGPSSQPPAAGSTPHATLLVDQTPPVVQLHEVRETAVFGKTVLQVKWSAFDSLFDARPVELEYQTGNEAAWRPITDAPIANTGRYDWTPPDELRGPVAVRVSAHDRGGFVTRSEPISVNLQVTRPFEPPPAASGSEPMDGARFEQRRDPDLAARGGPSVSGSPRARDRASQLIADAEARRDAGDAQGAIARYRDAVRLDPNRTDAFAEMARLFYGLGEWDRALSAYELVLQQHPSEREALLGAAMAHTKRKDYSSAGEMLRTILRHDPRDAEVWMNLGDVAIYGGDEVLARDCYMRASKMESSTKAIAGEAEKRLRLMDDVARRYTDR